MCNACCCRGTHSILQMWGPGDSLRSIMYSLQSPHLRNLVLGSLALAVAGRYLGPRFMWMPRWLRKGALGSLMSFWFVVIWSLYYHFNVVERPVLFFRRTSWNAMIMERFELPLFRPVFWAFNSHAQSVLCNSLNKLDEALKPFASYRREALPSFDGNSVVLDWAQDASTAGLPPDAPIVFILHGIYGDASDNYCRNIVDQCSSRGWRALVHDRWRIDFAETRDVEVALTAISKRYPGAPIFAIGFSAGGHVLLSYLERMGEDVPLVGAVAVSPALDLVKMIHHMRRHHNVSYRLAMDGSIRACVRRHVASDGLLDKEALRPFLARMGQMGAHEIYDNMLTRLSTFSNNPNDPYEARNWRASHPIMHDAAYVEPGPGTGVDIGSAPTGPGSVPSRPESPDTTPMPLDEWHTEGTTQAADGDGLLADAFGVRMLRIASRDTLRPLPLSAYSPFGNPTTPHYTQTAGNNLHRIRVPTLIMTAQDDPMMAPSFFPTLQRAAGENPHVVFARTKRGGHCAWHTGVYPAGASYAEQLAIDFIAAVVAAQSHTAFIVDVVRKSLSVAEEEAGGLRQAAELEAAAVATRVHSVESESSPHPSAATVPSQPVPTVPPSSSAPGSVDTSTWSSKARGLWAQLQAEVAAGNAQGLVDGVPRVASGLRRRSSSAVLGLGELRPQSLARLCAASSFSDMSGLPLSQFAQGAGPAMAGQ